MHNTKELERSSPNINVEALSKEELDFSTNV